MAVIPTRPSWFRRSLALMSLALALAVSVVERVSAPVWGGFSYALKTGRRIAAEFFGKLTSLAPDREGAFALMPRVKLLSAQAVAVSRARRERISIFARWRMMPST